MKRYIALGLLILSGAAQANMACGFPPFPPIGCQVGPCVCDGQGENCHWTFICE